MNPNSSRRAVRGVLNVTILLGVAIALSPVAQHGYGWWSQRQLQAQWEASSGSASAAKPAQKLAAKPKSLALASAPKPGGPHRKAQDAASAVTMDAQSVRPSRKAVPLPPTKLSIPEIGVDAVVVQGLDAKSLARGPGHDPNSALPGENGNCVLAAHRNVYGSWFYNLDQLWGGSVVELKSGGQSFRYSVISVEMVPEGDTSVLRSQPGAPPTLTLITCTMPHSPYRLVATAFMQTEPSQ